MPKSTVRSASKRVSTSQIADFFAEVEKKDGRVWKVTCRASLLKMVAKAMESALEQRKGKLHGWNADWVAVPNSELKGYELCLHYVRGEGKGKRYRRTFDITFYGPASSHDGISKKNQPKTKPTTTIAT